MATFLFKKINIFCTLKIHLPPSSLKQKPSRLREFLLLLFFNVQFIFNKKDKMNKVLRTETSNFFLKEVNNAHKNSRWSILFCGHMCCMFMCDHKNLYCQNLSVLLYEYQR